MLFKIPTVSSTPSSRICRSIYFSYSGQTELCTRTPIKNVRSCRCYGHIRLEIHNSGHILAVPATDIDLSLPRLIRIHRHRSDQENNKLQSSGVEKIHCHLLAIHFLTNIMGYFNFIHCSKMAVDFFIIHFSVCRSYTGLMYFSNAFRGLRTFLVSSRYLK